MKYVWYILFFVSFVIFFKRVDISFADFLIFITGIIFALLYVISVFKETKRKWLEVLKNI